MGEAGGSLAIHLPALDAAVGNTREKRTLTGVGDWFPWLHKGYDAGRGASRVKMRRKKNKVKKMGKTYRDGTQETYKHAKQKTGYKYKIRSLTWHSA